MHVEGPSAVSGLQISISKSFLSLAQLYCAQERLLGMQWLRQFWTRPAVLPESLTHSPQVPTSQAEQLGQLQWSHP